MNIGECGRFTSAILSLVLLFCFPAAQAQTSATGSLVGRVVDPANAVLPNADVTVENAAKGVTRTAKTNPSGAYNVSLLPPGTYTVTVTANGFKTQSRPAVQVNVTETTTLNVSMELGASSESVTVQAGEQLVQSENATTGGVVGEHTVQNLPLTNRNYTQILSLSPGVTSAVNNAAGLGRNTQDVNVNGSRVMDNSFQMDGEDATNNQTNRSGDVVSVAGISIPNPDAIQEFKVQTSLYDAGYGRGAGANVNVVTKSGTNEFHGTLFEYLRNDIFNANDWFLKRNHQNKPVFKQNQFGGAVGGPIKKDKIFFFGSYQGTRQVNGIGSNSLQSVFLPPLTDDRSAATLGQQFCGQAGKFGGVGVACDGSNINPVALKLLNYKLPNGTFIIPTPQTIQSSGLGFSVFSIPSHFTENQYLANFDVVLTPRQTLALRGFYSRDPETQSFSGSNTPGSGLTSFFENRNVSVRHTLILTSSLLNEASFGYHRIFGNILTSTPVTSAEIGLTPASAQTIIPTMSVTGLFSFGGTLNDGQHSVSETFSPHDQVSWQHGKHNTRAGFGYERVNTPFADPAITRGSLTFQSFPDFLLGMSAAQNGSQFSNLFSSAGRNGITDRDFHLNNYWSFVQDDYRVNERLTLNLGLRWDIYGQASDSQGRLVNFWPQLANNNFGPDGTNFSGFVAADNFAGQLPTGVVRSSNTTCCETGHPLGNFGPRVGIAWQPSGGNSNFVVRAGYGIYYTRTPINDVFQLIVSPPFLVSQINSGVLNGQATFQNPFNPGPPPSSALPAWNPRTLTSNLTMSTVAPNWQIPRTDQWGVSTQYAFAQSFVLQLGYMGTRGKNIEETRNINQAALASSSNPVNGITTNTIANASQRVPYLGFAPTGISQREDVGSSIYNGLQASLSRRFRQGLQFGASYTYSKTLSDVPGSGGFNLDTTYTNDVNNRDQEWGPADYDRKHRFVLNYLWNLPNIHQGSGMLGHILGGWEWSGVATFQTGTPLTFTDTRAGTIYGFSSQRAQFCPEMSNGDILTSGSTQSRVTSYFNTSAFCAPPTVGNGFGFGNASRGAVYGPGQRNVDMALAKSIHVGGFSEQGRVLFRAEFFNAFNTPQFANPSTNVSSASFGTITSTSVTPRLIQFALKYAF